MSTIDDWRFSTERLLLRPFEASDAPFVLKLLRDPGWRRFVGSTPADDIGDAERYVERLRASYAKHGFGLLRVEADSATPVGMCGLVRRESLSHPDLGFAFLSAHAGNGYATEAGLAVRDRTFSLPVTDTLLAITDPTNVASMSATRA